nr:MAG TPA_asm: hypothetical protein [Bacteriophage sp.]
MLYILTINIFLKRIVLCLGDSIYVSIILMTIRKVAKNLIELTHLHY